MLSPFIINDKNAHLERFPIAQVNRSLQAWDAADEYLVNHIKDEQMVNDKTRILIVNDNFGALTINYLTNEIYTVSDSYLSHQGIQANIALNNLEANNLTLLSSLDELPESVDLILYKLPKSKHLLTEQLSKIKAKYQKATFIACGKAKDIHSSTLTVFEKILGETKTSLAVKKARLIFSELNSSSPIITNHVKSWPLPNSHFTMHNYANVFAREKLDIGARLFLEHLPTIKANQQVIDLGCGNGVIGLSVLNSQPNCQLHFYDESYMAVASAKYNIEQNLPEQQTNCQFYVDDCLTQAENSSADVILCNPPFHQQNATTDHIAWQMFNDSFRVLNKGGELRIVGNRQLGYHIKLQRIFGQVNTIASNKKFVVLSAYKK